MSRFDGLFPVKLKLYHSHKNATWGQLYGVYLLCGVGFTMSLFISSLVSAIAMLIRKSSVKYNSNKELKNENNKKHQVSSHLCFFITG